MSSVPERLSPRASTSFSTSVACSVPMTPATAPRMPAVWQRRLAEEAAIAGMGRPEIGLEGRELPLEGRQRRSDQGAPLGEADIVEEITRRKIVAAVSDEVVALDQRGRVRLVEALRMRLDPHLGIDGGDRGARALDLGGAYARGRMNDLALQVREVDRVVIDDAERADAGGGEVEQHRRAQPAGADDEHARGHELGLPLLADFVEDEVAGVALELLLGERHLEIGR